MRNTLTAIVALQFLFAGAVFAATNSSEALPQYLGDHKWPVGEKLTYRLYWGYVPVGTAVIETEWTGPADRKLLAIRMRTESNKVIEKVYPVRDTIESLVDPETFLPVQFTKNLSEGTHRRYETTVFDRTNRVANWTARLSGRKKSFPIPPDIRDIPTLMYALRSHRFVPGSRETFKVMADEKVYDVGVTVRKKEKLDLPQHEDVRCILLEPDAAFEGIFVRHGRIWIWISDDERCLAARIEASIPVANVKAVLWSVEGPGNDRWIRKTEAPPSKGEK